MTVSQILIKWGQCFVRHDNIWQTIYKNITLITISWPSNSNAQVAQLRLPSQASVQCYQCREFRRRWVKANSIAGQTLYTLQERINRIVSGMRKGNSNTRAAAPETTYYTAGWAVSMVDKITLSIHPYLRSEVTKDVALHSVYHVALNEKRFSLLAPTSTKLS